MRINQKLRDAVKNKKRKEDKKNTQLVHGYIRISEHNRDVKKEQKCLVNIEILKCAETINKNEVLDYIALFQRLEDVKQERKYVKKMDTRLVPYEIPEFYSLQKDIEDIAVLKKRIDVLSKKICRKDIDSMTSDWKKVGGDINEAICKSRRIHAGGSD